MAMACALATLGAPVLAQTTAKTAQAAAPSNVLVESGPVRVTTVDVQAHLAGQPETQRRATLATEDSVGALANDLFIRRALARKAEAQGLGQSEQDKAVLQQARDRVLSDLLLARIDAANAQSEAQAEAKARELYQADPKRFEAPERVQARHILIIPTGDREAARKEATEVRKLAAAPGADFEALVLKYSDDPAKAASLGNLGYITRDSVVESFGKAAFALKPGQVSEVVESPHGFHVIRVDAHAPAGVRPFEEVKPMLMAQARQQVLLDARRREVEAVLKEASYHPAAVKALVRPPAAGQTPR